MSHLHLSFYAQCRSSRPSAPLSCALQRMGTVAGSIHDILPAKEIVDSMVEGARECLKRGVSMAKL